MGRLFSKVWRGSHPMKQVDRTDQRGSRGQALVELAILLPFLLVLMLGAGDFARGITAYIELGNMAREGAHFGSMNAANAVNTAGIAQAALNESGGTIYGVAPTVTSSTGTDGFSGSSGNAFTYVRVTVTYQFTPLFSFPPFHPLTLQRTAQMEVLGG